MSLPSDFEHSYDRLMSAWLAHEHLRHGGSIADLSASRAHLDGLRYEMAALRNRIA